MAKPVGMRADVPRDDEPGMVAPTAYTYVPVAIVFGLVLTAVADELVLLSPLEPEHGDWTAGLVCGAGAVYLLGNALFRRATGADAVGLGRGVDRDEDDIGLLDLPGDIGGEKEVLAPGLLYNVVEPRLEDRQVAAVPGRDARGVHVHDRHGDVGALEGNHGHGRATHVASADAADVHK